MWGRSQAEVSEVTIKMDHREIVLYIFSLFDDGLSAVYIMLHPT